MTTNAPRRRRRGPREGRRRRAILRRQWAELGSERRVKRVKTIAGGSVSMTAARRESGRRVVTVRVLADLLDHAVYESGSEVVETLWRLCAIRR